MLLKNEISPMDSRLQIRLFIVLPVYGNWGDTLNCLRNLFNQNNADFTVLLADDGSLDPPPAEVAEFGFVRYRRFPHRGFAGNCNAGASEAISLGATHLLFLNSDTVFSNEYIDGWHHAISDRPASILTPVIYFHDEPKTIWYSGGTKTIWTPFFRITKEYKETTPVDIICGCAMMVPAIPWKSLSGFDEKYVTYFEDLDLSLRAKRGEIETCVVPDLRLKTWHKIGRSFIGTGNWVHEYRMLPSSLRFIRYHYSGLEKILCLGLRVVQFGVTLLRQLPDIPDWKKLKEGVIEGTID